MKRKWFIFFIALCLAVLITGCEQTKNLKLKQIEELKSNIYKSHLRTVRGVKVNYSGAGVNFIITVKKCKEPEVYSILADIDALLQDKTFIDNMFEAYSKSLVDRNDWDNGYRPVVHVWFRDRLDRLERYTFIATYYTQNYNSGMAASDYIYDGYSTWYGSKVSGNDEVEISPKEIDTRIHN